MLPTIKENILLQGNMEVFSNVMYWTGHLYECGAIDDELAFVKKLETRSSTFGFPFSPLGYECIGDTNTLAKRSLRAELVWPSLTLQSG